MGMREDCTHFESRTLANGDSLRRCDLGLAPEAPFRCPADCARYEGRRIDLAWSAGSFAAVGAPEELPGLEDGSAAAVLADVEALFAEVAPDALAEHAAAQGKRRKGNGAKRKRYKRK
jgi:hypothetical protein